MFHTYAKEYKNDLTEVPKDLIEVLLQNRGHDPEKWEKTTNTQFGKPRGAFHVDSGGNNFNTANYPMAISTKENGEVKQGTPKDLGEEDWELTNYGHWERKNLLNYLDSPQFKKNSENYKDNPFNKGFSNFLIEQQLVPKLNEVEQLKFLSEYLHGTNFHTTLSNILSDNTYTPNPVFLGENISCGEDNHYGKSGDDPRPGGYCQNFIPNYFGDNFKFYYRNPADTGSNKLMDSFIKKYKPSDTSQYAFNPKTTMPLYSTNQTSNFHLPLVSTFQNPQQQTNQFSTLLNQPIVQTFQQQNAPLLNQNLNNQFDYVDNEETYHENNGKPYRTIKGEPYFYIDDPTAEGEGYKLGSIEEVNELYKKYPWLTTEKKFAHGGPVRMSNPALMSYLNAMYNRHQPTSMALEPLLHSLQCFAPRRGHTEVNTARKNSKLASPKKPAPKFSNAIEQAVYNQVQKWIADAEKHKQERAAKQNRGNAKTRATGARTKTTRDTYWRGGLVR